MASILIVDDEPLVLKTVRIILEHAGHIVFEADDGQACEEVLRFARPDVVVMDIFMPRRDGLDAIRRIRRQGGGCPILAMSGGNRSESSDPLVLAREAGAAATLQKPFDNETLLQAVEALLPANLRPRRLVN
jgi:CheY-like chemotaxis protein